MSDVDTLIEMLTRAGVPFTDEPQTPRDTKYPADAATRVISIPRNGEQGTFSNDFPDTVHGYAGFYAVWYFGADGRLLATGSFE